MKLLVAGVAACFGSEHGGNVISGAVPVGEKPACGRIEVDEAGIVGGPARVGENRGVESTGEAVGGEHVVPGVANPGRSVGDGVENLLDTVRDAGCSAAPLPWWGGLSGARQVEQVATLGLVQLKRACDSVEDGLGRPGEVPAFHADVVIDAHPGEQRDLFAPQPLDPAVVSTVGGSPACAGEIRSRREIEELADLVSVVHATTVGAVPIVREVLALPGTAGTPNDAGQRLN